jgi:membrane protein YqaA with SNARE-associated domain
MRTFFSFRTLFALGPLVLSVGLSAFFFLYVTPDVLVNRIGLENAYALMFFVATIGGMTTFNTVPYYSMLLVLATAGVNPLFLGLSSALGVMCGDSLSYLIGNRGAAVVPTMFHSLFEYIRHFAIEKPRFFPLLCLLYGTFSPLSNDIITIPAGIAKVPFFRVMAPLAVGNIIFNVTLAYLAVYAYETVKALLVG